jgi:hypothetical protein
MVHAFLLYLLADTYSGKFASQIFLLIIIKYIIHSTKSQTIKAIFLKTYLDNKFRLDISHHQAFFQELSEKTFNYK